MHASAGVGGPVDILVGGEEVASDVSFSSETTSPTVSDYFSINVGSSTEIEVQDDGGNSLLSTDAASENLEEGNKYTVIVAGAATSSNSPKAIVLQDQFRELASDEVGIRLVHGSAEAGPVDIYLTAPGATLSNETPLAEDFMFTNDTGQFPGQFAPQQVTSSGSELSVTPAGNPGTVALQLDVGTGDPGSLPVTSGQHITGVAIDAPDGGVGALVLVETPDN
jgi:hypothetical protein